MRGPGEVASPTGAAACILSLRFRGFMVAVTIFEFATAAFCIWELVLVWISGFMGWVTWVRARLVGFPSSAQLAGRATGQTG